MTRAPRILGTLLAFSLLLSGSAAEAGRATNFTVRDLDGKYVRLSDFKDKLVYLSFWATWCKPCVNELKHLRKLYDKYRSKGLVVLAVSLDGPETRAKVKPLVRRYRLKFPVVHDAEGRVVKLYNPKRALPFSVMIRKGRVIKTRTAFQVSDVPLIEQDIKKAL